MNRINNGIKRDKIIKIGGMMKLIGEVPMDELNKVRKVKILGLKVTIKEK